MTWEGSNSDTLQGEGKVFAYFIMHSLNLQDCLLVWMYGLPVFITEAHDEPIHLSQLID